MTARSKTLLNQVREHSVQLAQRLMASAISLGIIIAQTSKDNLEDVSRLKAVIAMVEHITVLMKKLPVAIFGTVITMGTTVT